MRTWRVAGINFDHLHMGDLLREVHDHPHAEIVGIWHSEMERMTAARSALGIPDDRVFADVDRCIRTTKPDLIILCPATAAHADWVEKVAPYGIDILVEKPFAATLADADRMIAAADKAGIRMAINWPLAWYPSHVTAKRLADEGAIGRIVEVHYYDGNRGPLYHVADKIEVSPDEVVKQKPNSWWYKKAFGGGSLLDYLGYGVTLGSWYLGGRGSSRGDHGRRSPGRPRGRRALDYNLSLQGRPLQVRDPVGNLHRPLDAAAPAEMRLCSGRKRRHDLEL